jgi:hypothetical protein
MLPFGVQDTKGVVGKLENIFAVIIHFVFFVAYLSIFQVQAAPHPCPLLHPCHLTSFNTSSSLMHAPHLAWVSLPRHLTHARVCVSMRACNDFSYCEH